MIILMMNGILMIILMITNYFCEFYQIFKEKTNLKSQIEMLLVFVNGVKVTTYPIMRNWSRKEALT
jgi:hypothetical protein